MRTHLSSFFKSPAIRRWTLFTVVLTPLLATLAATQPAWWSSGDHPILNVHPANNLGTANLGQAKHMAASAIEALREVAPVVAANIEADLAGTVDLTVPNPQTPEWLARQQGALVLGQLKALATPFYDRLHSVAPEWLEQQRAAAGSQHTGTHLPWTPDTIDDANTSPANIGQLKAVFALDFATLPAASLDSDGDDMPDAWEIANGLNANDPADANEDPDSDGLTNAQEQIIGADPNVAEPHEDIGDEAVVNGDFSQPQIYVPGGPNGNGTTGLEATKGAAGWNYWAGIPGWKAVVGEHVELQEFVSGPENSYVELKAEPEGHRGIQQWIKTRVGVTYIVHFKCMPRPYVESASLSNFDVYADDTRIKEITFTDPINLDTLDWEAHAAVFTAERALTKLAFVIPDSNPDNSLGGLVDDVTVGPVEVVELAPKIRDADNNEIIGSELPICFPRSNSMVEEAPYTNRIAHREMKVKIGSALKDKTITWSMDPHFTPEGQNQPLFRGDWARAVATHQNRFEVSSAYGSHEFNLISQEQAVTAIDAEGFTAIRANLPPVGLNKARIRIQIEGITTPIDLIDLDVQAVVVIDPGHGGTPETDYVNSTWNNATSPSGVLEKTMALNYGLALKESLESHAEAHQINLKVLMTRETDVSVNSRNRAYIARDNGADQIFIIHFNAFTDDDGSAPDRSHTVRGSQEVRQNPNLPGSLPEDMAFIDTVLNHMVPAIQELDAAASRHAHFVKDTTVATDEYLGNEANYHPVRAGYCEIEFIDFGAQTPDDRTDDAVDILLNTGPNAGRAKAAIANAIRDAMIQDLRTQPTR